MAKKVHLMSFFAIYEKRGTSMHKEEMNIKCKFCRKEISKETKACPFCERKVTKKNLTWFYWSLIGLAALSIWLFAFRGTVFIANLFYSDGFIVEANFERNIISLAEMTIEIDPDFDATFTNRMNYYHGLLIGVFDGEIYSALSGGEVRVIQSDDLETHEIVYPTRGGRTFTQIHIENGVLYYTPRHHSLERYDFGHTNQSTTITDALVLGIGAFVKFDDSALHRAHNWNFRRHHAYTRVDGNIYLINLESGDSEIWLKGRVREFFVDEQNDRILFSEENYIFEDNFEGTNRNLITDEFFHYSRSDAFTTRGWMYDGNRVVWIDSGDWTGLDVTFLESSLFAFNFNTGEEEYLGRIGNASTLNAIDDYVLVGTTDGYLYLVDIDANHRRVLADDVDRFSVIGNRIFYQQIGERSVYIMDLDGNVAFFDRVGVDWLNIDAPDAPEYEMGIED